MNERENFLRSLEFRNPQWIPFSVGFAWPVWHKYREDLEELVVRYPKVFGHYQKGSVSFDADPGPCHRQGEYFRDNWGCLWYNIHRGLEGQVVESPLADWKALDTYQPPDLLKYTERGQRDWDRIKTDIEERKKRGFLTWGDGERLFDRLYFLRGFENLMVDIATDDPHLPQLINMLTEYEMRLVQKWLSISVDVIGFHTDIGIQDRLMISPVKFRKYIKPMFKQLFMTCRNAGVHVLLSSDGRLLSIVDDLIECGVSRHDPQIRANTLEGIEKFYKGKICINLDLDRQMFPFCSPGDIKEQVKEAVERLSLPEGGLMIFADVRDANIPLENIEALCEAGEEYCLAQKPE
jgi:hypothetical protein